MLWLEISIIAGLILLNGFFAMSELAVVSARRARLQIKAEAGSRGAAEALLVAAEPGRFLSTVQIGITLIGIFAGAYGGAKVSAPLGDALIAMGMGAELARSIALTGVVVAITYLSLIVGELVPKQLALSHAETIATWVALPMRQLSRVCSPLVWLLEHSSSLVLKLIGAHRRGEQTVTEEEVKSIIAEAAEAGVVLAEERDLMARVMTFADLRVQALMTPRPEIVSIDFDADSQEILETLQRYGHSQFPVVRGELDNLEGIVYTRDLLTQVLSGQSLELTQAVQKPLVVFAGQTAVTTLEKLRLHAGAVAMVVDEYGHVLGIVTAADILSALTGGLADREEQADPSAVLRPDGSWLLDGALALEEAWARLDSSPRPERSDYYTLAGFVLDQLGRIPQSGDAFTWGSHRFEVVDMDGYRIDKVLVTPLLELDDG
jgi:putative hemolysin